MPDTYPEQHHPEEIPGELVSQPNHGCPLEASLDVGESILLARHEDSFVNGANDKQLSLGNVAAARLCLMQLRDSIDCPGSSVNASGVLECPLSQAVMHARNFGWVRPSSSFNTRHPGVLDPTAAGLTYGGRNGHGTGQYM